MPTEERCRLIIDGQNFEFGVQGNFFVGDDVVLYNKNTDNSISGCSWEHLGYKIIDVFNSDEYENLLKSVKKNIIEGIKNIGLVIDEQEFKLQNYHKYITKSSDHYQIVNHTKNLINDDFDINIDKLIKKFEDHVRCNLSSHIKDLGKSHVQIRIIRPNSLDINPPHRDSYLDYWKKILNVWIPITGSNKNSSLPIVPKSHLLSEKKILRTKAREALINGNLYTVPCIISTTEGPFEMIRPNPQKGQALIFTPYLIHGAAINNNNDTTRISLELRFEKAETKD